MFLSVTEEVDFFCLLRDILNYFFRETSGNMMKILKVMYLIY